MTNGQKLTTKAKAAVNTVWHSRVLIVTVWAVLAALSLFVVSKMERQYVAGANLLVVNGTTRDDPTLSSPDLPAIAKSTVVLSRTKKALGLSTPLVAIKKQMTVKAPAFRSSILRIEYTDSQPDRAMMIANGVAEQLSDYYREISTARFDADLRTLDAEMGRERELGKQLDRQIGAAEPSSVITDKGTDTVSSRLADLETNQALADATLRGDLSTLRALDSEIQRQQNTARFEVLRNDPTYQSIAASASSSEATLANARATFTSNYPALPALEEKVRSLQVAARREASNALRSTTAYSPTMVSAVTARERARAQVDADRAKLTALTGLLRDANARAKASPSREALRLERDAARQAYLSLSARRATAVANRADALSLGSVVIVDRAIASDAQVGPGKKRIIAMLGLLVFVLGLASAFVAEQLSPRLGKLEEIEELYGRPVVVTVGKS